MSADCAWAARASGILTVVHSVNVARQTHRHQAEQFIPKPDLKTELNHCGSLPSLRCGLQPLNSEFIAPSLESLTRDTVELQIVEGVRKRNRVDQRRELAVE